MPGFSRYDDRALFALFKQGVSAVKTNPPLNGLSPVAFIAILSEDRPDAVFKEGVGILSGGLGEKTE